MEVWDMDWDGERGRDVIRREKGVERFEVEGVE